MAGSPAPLAHAAAAPGQLVPTDCGGVAARLKLTNDPVAPPAAGFAASARPTLAAIRPAAPSTATTGRRGGKDGRKRLARECMVPPRSPARGGAAPIEWVSADSDRCGNRGSRPAVANASQLSTVRPRGGQ